MVRGGYIAFYGPPEEALTYFDQYRTDHERRIKDIEDTLDVLENALKWMKQTKGNGDSPAPAEAEQVEVKGEEAT